MAKIAMSRATIPAAVGLINIGAKQLDPMVPPVAGWTLSEITQAGMTLGSFALNYMGKSLEKTELVFNASLPLFEDLLVKKIMQLIPATTVPAPRTVPTAPRTVGSSPTPSYSAASKYRITG
jgi:hypothetical protein